MATTILNPEEESQFQREYSIYAKNTGMSKNPDDPEHYYDYRGAWKGGAKLNKIKSGEHMDSRFKLEGHPRTYVDPRTDKGSAQKSKGYEKTYAKGGAVRGHGIEQKGRTKGRII